MCFCSVSSGYYDLGGDIFLYGAAGTKHYRIGHRSQSYVRAEQISVCGVCLFIHLKYRPPTLFTDA